MQVMLAGITPTSPNISNQTVRYLIFEKPCQLVCVSQYITRYCKHIHWVDTNMCTTNLYNQNRFKITSYESNLVYSLGLV